MKKTVLILGLMLTLSATAFAQTKIGYANVEIVVAYMEETKAMQQQIQTFENKLAEQLRIKEQYAQTKLVEYQEKAQTGATEEELKPLQEELQKLDQEIGSARQDAQQKALAKRQETLAPITEKVSTTLRELAQSEGYTLVLNTTDGSGTSIVLYAPEEHDLTMKLAEKLGVKFPEGEASNQ